MDWSEWQSQHFCTYRAGLLCPSNYPQPLKSTSVVLGSVQWMCDIFKRFCTRQSVSLLSFSYTPVNVACDFTSPVKQLVIQAAFIESGDPDEHEQTPTCRVQGPGCGNSTRDRRPAPFMCQRAPVLRVIHYRTRGLPLSQRLRRSDPKCPVGGWELGRRAATISTTLGGSGVHKFVEFRIRYIL